MTLEAIKLLKNEHQLIMRAMQIVEVMSRKICESSRIQKDDLIQILDFIKSYADKFHHKKEENVLFIWMQEKGFPSQMGPIPVMLYEHDVGRGCVQKIDEILSGKNDVSATDSQVIANELAHFCNHLAQHIFKEDNMLYPMAERLADDKSDQELLRRYDAQISILESQKINDHYGELIFILEKKYSAAHAGG